MKGVTEKLQRPHESVPRYMIIAISLGLYSSRKERDYSDTS